VLVTKRLVCSECQSKAVRAYRWIDHDISPTLALIDLSIFMRWTKRKENGRWPAGVPKPSVPTRADKFPTRPGGSTRSSSHRSESQFFLTIAKIMSENPASLSRYTKLFSSRELSMPDISP
jgi:hypothetical protein